MVNLLVKSVREKMYEFSSKQGFKDSLAPEMQLCYIGVRSGVSPRVSVLDSSKY